MADLDQKVPENVAGRFFVDATCIDCDLCREVAPKSFARLDGEGYSYVFRQPTSPEEEKDCRAAMDECPVEAIGIEPER